MAPSTIFLIIVAVFTGSGGGILLKVGSSSLRNGDGVISLIYSVLTSPLLLFAFFLYSIPSFIAIYLLKEMEISVLQPILSLTYVTTAILAYVLLRENLSCTRLLGIMIIVGGVALVARS